MAPDYKTASDVTVAVPVDIARFRFSAYASEDDYPDIVDGVDGLFASRVESAVDMLESMTGLSLKRATYACEWKELPVGARSGISYPLTFPGFHATVDRFERVTADGTAVALDGWRRSPGTEVGSVLVEREDGDWSMYDAPEGTVGWRVTGTAGCELATNKLPGNFFEGLALGFRYLWMNEPEAMAAMKVILNRWIVAGSSE